MSYLAPVAVLLMVLFPVLLPAAISGFHAISTAGRSRPIARIQTTARRPRRIWFVDELPKGPTGKILKRDMVVPVEV